MTKDIIILKLPKKPDYVSLARLSVSGICNTIGLSIDDIEDIKVVVGEACINSLMSNDQEDISLEFIIDEEKLLIKVTNVMEIVPEYLDEKKERELGLLIIKSLMDDVKFTERGIEMIKYIEDDDQ